MVAGRGWGAGGMGELLIEMLPVFTWFPPVSTRSRPSPPVVVEWWWEEGGVLVGGWLTSASPSPGPPHKAGAAY